MRRRERNTFGVHVIVCLSAKVHRSVSPAHGQTASASSIWLHRQSRLQCQRCLACVESLAPGAMTRSWWVCRCSDGCKDWHVLLLCSSTHWQMLLLAAHIAARCHRSAQTSLGTEATCTWRSESSSWLLESQLRGQLTLMPRWVLRLTSRPLDSLIVNCF